MSDAQPGHQSEHQPDERPDPWQPEPGPPGPGTPAQWPRPPVIGASAAAAYPGPAAPAPAAPAAYPGVAAQPWTGPASPAQVTPPAVPQIPAQRPAAIEPAFAVPALVQPWQQKLPAPLAQPWTAATAGTAATVAAAATPAAEAAAATGAMAAPPATAGSEGPRPSGTAEQSQHGPREGRRGALSRRLTPLHAGWHLVSIEALSQLNGASSGTGLILGVDQDRRPILVRFFRPEPTKVTLVGGVWAQRLLAFRALALGARVVLITTDPGAWQGFGELATGRSDRVALWNDPRPPVVPATAEQPALIVHDTGSYGATPLPEPRPWQTQMVVLRQLGADNARALQDCHLLIMQRLAAPEASVAVPALGLPEQSARLLQGLGEDMLALLDGEADRYVWLSPTAIERQYNGAPHR
ncbi:hypothetical protein GCM10023322_28370 [Rugosimonospora acidiphila]|uniref:SseB protein N-terminal domain-containing protein n=1 Tax=Rugosimonospora acidiphila TaxID=556531 RepID=A0ABP9RR14_9ACTN